MKKYFVCIGICVLIIVITTILVLIKPSTIYLASNNGDKVHSLYVKKGNKIGKLEIPEKEGYKFLYWTIDGNIIDENFIVNSDKLILVANYEKIVEDTLEKITVKFDTDGGNVIESVIINFGDVINEPTIPKKEGYIFEHWNLNDDIYDFTSRVTNDITLKAIYTKSNDKTYTVTFDTNGGSRINQKIVKENTSVSKPTNPTKKGYIFKEWQLNGKTYNFNSKITNDITLRAIYDKADENIAIENIKFEKENYELDVGKSLTLNAIIEPNNLSNVDIVWKSSDESIATVNKGIVTAKKNGVVIITAMVNDKIGSTKITVINSITYIYEIIDIPGSTIGQAYLYIKDSNGNRLDGSATITYQNGASEDIDVTINGYLLPSKSAVKNISNIKIK